MMEMVSKPLGSDHNTQASRRVDYSGQEGFQGFCNLTLGCLHEYIFDKMNIYTENVLLGSSLLIRCCMFSNFVSSPGLQMFCDRNQQPTGSS